MSGYAVRKDGQGYRSVDGPSPDPDDASKLFPDPKTETYTSDLPPDPVALPPTAEELLSVANSKRDELLALATLRINPLQDAVDLGDASDSDTTLLKLWKQYRVAVNRTSAQPGFPEEIDWPSPPN